MATFVKLTLTKTDKYKWFNMDQVQTIEGHVTKSCITFPQEGNCFFVKESPEEIMELMEPGKIKTIDDLRALVRASKVVVDFIQEEEQSLDTSKSLCEQCITQPEEEGNPALCMECQANEYSYFKRKSQ